VDSCSRFSFQEEGEAADERDLRFILWFRAVFKIRGPCHDRLYTVYHSCGFWFNFVCRLTFWPPTLPKHGLKFATQAVRRLTCSHFSWRACGFNCVTFAGWAHAGNVSLLLQPLHELTHARVILGTPEGSRWVCWQQGAHPRRSHRSFPLPSVQYECVHLLNLLGRELLYPADAPLLFCGLHITVLGMDGKL
jgi:hypothetical protein